jgi:hypothetical protein
VEALFEWVKLDAKEQVFHFELCDFNELTRNIVAEWVPTLERNHFEYDFYTTNLNDALAIRNGRKIIDY